MWNPTRDFNARFQLQPTSPHLHPRRPLWAASMPPLVVMPQVRPAPFQHVPPFQPQAVIWKALPTPTRNPSAHRLACEMEGHATCKMPVLGGPWWSEISWVDPHTSAHPAHTATGAFGPRRTFRSSLVRMPLLSCQGTLQVARTLISLALFDVERKLAASLAHSPTNRHIRPELADRQGACQ